MGDVVALQTGERLKEQEWLAQQQERARYERDLYGALLYLNPEHREAEVDEYVLKQEQTHIAEGIELQQTTVRTMTYEDGHVRVFGRKSLAESCYDGYLVAKKQYLAGDTSAYGLMRRREHDVTIAGRLDELMAHGEVGDAIFVNSPYEEEVEAEWGAATALRLGFWPAFRRGYGWLYRKTSETELECSDISLDDSDLATHLKLLESLGVDIPEGTKSHEVPAHHVELKGITSDDQRNEVIGRFRGAYRQLRQETRAEARRDEDPRDSVEFLDRYAAHYLRLLVDTQKSVARTLETGTLHDIVRLGASRALRKLDCLDEGERRAVTELLTTDVVDERHLKGLGLVVKAQRVGIWKGVSKILGGELPAEEPATEEYESPLTASIQQAVLLDEIYGNTNQAAEEGDVMPGCSGGASFLSQSNEDIKDSIFKAEIYKFNKKMHCVVCDPKQEKTEVMCGPCGICRTCDFKIKHKQVA